MSDFEAGYATAQEVRAITFALLRLTMSEPQEAVEQIRNGQYLCFVDAVPEVVRRRFIAPPFDEVVQPPKEAEVRLHLKNIATPQDSLASVALQHCVTSTYAVASIGVQYDVLSQTEKEGPCLRVSSSLNIFPSEHSPTKLGMSAEAVADRGLDWPPTDLPRHEAQLYIALHAARDREQNPMAHEALSSVERAKLAPAYASSPEAHFLVELVQQAPNL